MTDSALRHIVIVGHGIAGLSAGDALRREGFTGHLTVVGEEPHAPYSRPALSKSVLAGPTGAPGSSDGTADAGPDRRVGEVQPQFLAASSNGAEVLTGRSAVRLDPAARTVLLDDGRRLGYDGLVIATGASARRFTQSPDEYTLRGLDDARTLHRRLVDRPHVTVVGGGPLGMEVASSARSYGCEVTLVHRGRPMTRQVGDYLAELCTAAARDHGVRLLDAAVTGITGGPLASAPEQPAAGLSAHRQPLTLHLSTGDTVAPEMLVTAIGDSPRIGWLAGSGLLSEGRLVTDRRGLITPGIVAAGDVSWRRTGVGPVRRALWTDAIEEAQAAAAALLHGPAADPPRFTPYFWTEQFGLNLRISGTIPSGTAPEVVDGDPQDRKALLRWSGASDGDAAASLNYRIPIPRLRRLASTSPSAV